MYCLEETLCNDWWWIWIHSINIPYTRCWSLINIANIENKLLSSPAAYLVAECPDVVTGVRFLESYYNFLRAGAALCQICRLHAVSSQDWFEPSSPGDWHIFTCLQCFPVYLQKCKTEILKVISSEVSVFVYAHPLSNWSPPPIIDYYHSF